METNAPAGAFNIVLMVVSVYALALPWIISVAGRRRVLRWGAGSLCIVTALILGGGTISGNGLSFIAVMPIAGVCWIGAMICGAAAYVDERMHERNRELAVRLLHNDDTGLPGTGTPNREKPR